MTRASRSSDASPGLKWKANERHSASGTESRVTAEWKTSIRGTRNIETGRFTFEARTAKASVSTTVSFTRETCAASSGAAPPRTAAAADGGVATAATPASCRSPSSVTTAQPGPSAERLTAVRPVATSTPGCRASASVTDCRPPRSVKLRGKSFRRVSRILNSIPAGKASALCDGTAESIGPRTFA